jgi:hypothetical protein
MSYRTRLFALCVAVGLAACSGDRSLDGGEALAKRAIRGPADLAIRLVPAAVGAEIEFSRSVSGRRSDFAWSTTTDWEGYADLRIAPIDADVSGYYRVRATSANGISLGEWNSVPVNGGTTSDLVLTVGGRAQTSTKRNAITYLYTFENTDDGWVGDFADVPEDTSEADYNLRFEPQRPLPVLLGDDRSVPFTTGVNRSDDLFVFLKRSIDGLTPNTEYDVDFTVEFATRLPSGALGVGGSPESVYMKAGVTLVEPVPVVDESDGHLRMNIDKANQSQSGPDMQVIGHAAKYESESIVTFQMKTNGTRDTPFSFTSDGSGAAWLVVGTDSGFESLTELYWSRIRVTFIPR